MYRRAGAFALLIGGVVFAQDIHLKTRTLQGGSATGPTGDTTGDTDTATVHKIVQFDHAAGADDLDSFSRDGITVVAALPDNAVVVAAPGGQLPPRPGVRWIGGLQPSDKLSPLLGLAFQQPEDTAAVIVEFHADVTAGQQETVGGAEQVALLRPAVLRSNHALVQATAAQLAALALHDEVAYLFPADPALLTDAEAIACAGIASNAGIIGQYANIVHGWSLDADNAAHLGYFFSSVTPKVPALTVQSEVVRAFSEWAKHTNLIFQPVAIASSPRTVTVKFVSGAHGDPWPFDGPGGTLAHTFYPVPINTETIAGDMHLDADENWHAGGDIDIYSVALHEAGHAIGLGHSDKPGDVMYPYYRSHSALSANDIGAAQTLYGLPDSGASAAPVTKPANPTGSGATPPAPVALRMVLDPGPASTTLSGISVTGTLSGGTAPYSVQWQTDHGSSGKALVQTSSQAATSFTASGITLVNGANAITVTAFDAAQKSTSEVATVVLQAPSGAGPALPVGIKATNPAASVFPVNGAFLTVSGTATGVAGISRVTWQTAAGASGVAAGTDHWQASQIPLLTGTNTIVLKAWDTKGNSAWTALVATRR